MNSSRSVLGIRIADVDFSVASDSHHRRKKLISIRGKLLQHVMHCSLTDMLLVCAGTFCEIIVIISIADLDEFMESEGILLQTATASCN